MLPKSKAPALQVSFAGKAAALKAASGEKAGIPAPFAEADAKHRSDAALAPQLCDEQHTSKHVHDARGPPSQRSCAVPASYVRKAAALKAANLPCQRLLTKPEVMAITGTSYPTIWDWMRKGKFPRARIVGGKSMWLLSEVEQWLAALPLRPLKATQEAR
jgi:predicted DNA-binding transcriptional regulator AlpA